MLSSFFAIKLDNFFVFRPGDASAAGKSNSFSRRSSQSSGRGQLRPAAEARSKITMNAGLADGTTTRDLVLQQSKIVPWFE
jgi:hypothetical protein